MDRIEIIRQLRVRAQPPSNAHFTDAKATLLGAAADMLEVDEHIDAFRTVAAERIKELEAQLALALKPPPPAAPTPQGALLWLRRELEGHYTLLLEGPGTPCKAIGFVLPQYRDAEIQHTILCAAIEHQFGEIAFAIHRAWKKGLAQ
jgi:hypothetical protein